MGSLKRMIPNKIAEKYNKYILSNQTAKLHKNLQTINLANQLESSERQRLREKGNDIEVQETAKIEDDGTVKYSKILKADKLTIADRMMREKFSLEKEATPPHNPAFQVGDDSLMRGRAHSKVSFSESKKPKSMVCRLGIKNCQCDTTNNCVGIFKDSQ